MGDEILALALQQIGGRAGRYRALRRYYDGQHPLAFATSKYRSAFGDLFRAFALNLCPAVVDAVADRLVVTGFQVGEGAAGDGVEAEAAAIWAANRMDRRSGEVHLEALISGDAYVLVWPDRKGLPRIWPERAAHMTVRYADDGEDPEAIAWAAKAWMLDDNRARLNLYFPDRIEKYVTTSSMSGGGLTEKASAFREHVIAGEPWPLPNPWGRVPVFHFGNNAATAEPGRSELHDVVPVQNALNKSVTDMLIAAEYAAYRQRWATGIEIPVDPDTGQPVQPFRAAVDRLWAVAEESVQFGEFSAADLAQMRGVVDGFKADIATVHGTPLHYFNLTKGDFPSGEALKTAEARFVKRVRDRQVAFGNVWEDVMHFALMVAGAGETGELRCLWEDPAPRSEREMVELAVMKLAAGVSKHQVLRELGYEKGLIEEMMAANEEAADAAMERELGRFDRGLAGLREPASAGEVGP